MTNLNNELSSLYPYFKKYFRVYLIILSFLILILAFTPCSSAITNNSSNNNYHIYYLDKSLGGNVQANPEISQNIPKTDLSNKIFSMTKNGSVVLKFGNGNGPKLLISAGIHGNEEESNIAVMKYLEYIQDKSFNGTLYIIPFDIPRDTAFNSRYYLGKDPNRIANVKGTPGYNIIQFAKNNGINYLLDVHSGGGVTPAGWVYVNSPSTITSAEKNWSSYIKTKAGCKIILNPDNSPGMLRDYANSKGINCITLEVERDTMPTTTSACTLYKMIIAAVKYLGFPGYISTKPAIFSTNPPKSASQVSLTAPISINFTNNILAGPNFNGIYIKNLTTGKKVSLASKTIKGNILTLKQTYIRLSKYVYLIYISLGAVKDRYGNCLSTAYSYKFKTI